MPSDLPSREVMKGWWTLAPQVASFFVLVPKAREIWLIWSVTMVRGSSAPGGWFHKLPRCRKIQLHLKNFKLSVLAGICWIRYRFITSSCSFQFGGFKHIFQFSPRSFRRGVWFNHQELKLVDFWQQLKDKAAIGNSLIDVIIARVKMLAIMV